MRIFILLISVGFSLSLFSQNDSTATKGEVIDGEIVIEKEKKIILPKADKIFKKAELKSFNSDPLKLAFEVFQPSFDWPNYKSDVPFQNIDKKYPSPKYQSYLKLGFGNYSSPLMDVGVFKQVGKLKLSTGLFHESFATGPIMKKFSSESKTKFNLAAKYQTKGFAITPYLGVSNQQYNFYGNTDRINTGFSSEAPDEVRYNKLLFGALLDGSSKGLTYYVKTEIANSSQKLDDGTLVSKEPSVKALAGITLKIDTAFSVGFDLEGYSSNYESGISYDRSLFQLKPWIGYLKNELTFKAGFSVASSKTSNNKLSGFYPSIEAEWKFNPDWSVYGFGKGGVDWTDLDQIISENRFLDDSLVIANSETKLKVGGGIRGMLIKNLRVSAGLSYASINNLPFYAPSSQDSARFSLIYDTKNVEKVVLEVGAVYSPNSTSNYGAEVEINSYSLNDLDKPWHLPTFQLKVYSTHNINQKVIFSTSIISLAGIDSPSKAAFGRERLPSIVDLNMGVKYLITSRSSVFIDANNLLNKEYERYIGYPVRGITFKIGGKYRF